MKRMWVIIIIATPTKSIQLLMPCQCRWHSYYYYIIIIDIPHLFPIIVIINHHHVCLPKQNKPTHKTIKSCKNNFSFSSVPETHISTHPGQTPGSVVTPVHGQLLQQPLLPLLLPLLQRMCSPPPVIQLSATVRNVTRQGTFQIGSSPVTSKTNSQTFDSHQIG